MSEGNTGDAKARYTLKPRITPLPSSAPKAAGSPAKTPQRNTAVRAANEDDDLYDPYSDYHDGTLRPLEFERDPWR